MKGDIAFVGFMLTAEEWQELDAASRAALIAVATRRADAVLAPPRRMPEGTGKHEVIDMIEADLDDLLEPDPDVEAAIREDELTSREQGSGEDDGVVADDDAADEGFEDFAEWAEL